MTSQKSYLFKGAVELVLNSAQKYHDRPAIELHNRSFSYKELIETAGGIANYVSSLNDLCPFIGVLADKSFNCYASVLGILMAGKAYMPLNPRFPEARNRYMIEKARVNTILSDSKIEQLNIRSHTNFNFQFSNFNSPAYLLFTSGTTGTPKGVPVSHENLAAYLLFMLDAFDFNQEDRFTQIFDLTFDLSVHDIFLAWSSGACLCVPSDNSSFSMSKFIKDKKPTVWFSVPSVINLMDRMRLLKPDVFPSIRLSFFCGEALRIQTALAWRKAASQSRLINLYGPTEATIAISKYEFSLEPSLWKSELGIASIGRIFPGNSFRIDFQTKENEQGELCLTGKQLVDGYFENEPADESAFFLDPVTDRKYYRTGDMVRLDKDEDLFYFGRKDSEVKISGYRVNLKEIENLLETHEMVNQSVVVFEQEEEGAGIPVAYILPASSDRQADFTSMLKLCQEYLPWYMVPGKFIFVDDIPLNLNGKVDKTALVKKYHEGK